MRLNILIFSSLAALIAGSSAARTAAETDFSSPYFYRDEIPSAEKRAPAAPSADDYAPDMYATSGDKRPAAPPPRPTSSSKAIDQQWLDGVLGRAVPTPSSAPVSDPSCKQRHGTVYDASGYLYDAIGESCGIVSIDHTVGQHAPKPGQQLFMVPGRLRLHLLGATVRAYPNTAYFLHPEIADLYDGPVDGVASVGRYAWAQVPYILPFMPTTVGQVGTDKRVPIWAYTDLVPVPGLEREMAPLHRRSVVIAIDGVVLEKPGALQRVLEAQTESRYAELLFIDRDDPGQRMQRAFVRVFPRSRAAVAWATLAAAHPLEASSGNAVFEQLASYAVIAAGMSAIVWFNQTETGQRYRQHVEECKRNASAYTIC